MQVGRVNKSQDLLICGNELRMQRIFVFVQIAQNTQIIPFRGGKIKCCREAVRQWKFLQNIAILDFVNN